MSNVEFEEIRDRLEKLENQVGTLAKIVDGLSSFVKKFAVAMKYLYIGNGENS